MNLSLKIKTIVSILLLLVAIPLSAQDQSALDEDWKNLKKSLSDRTKIIEDVLPELGKSSVIEGVDVKTARVKAEALQALLKKANALTEGIKTTNKELTQSFTRVLIQMEQDPMLKAGGDVTNLLKELQQLEQKLAIVVKAYNDQCVKMKREDLRFE